MQLMVCLQRLPLLVLVHAWTSFLYFLLYFQCISNLFVTYLSHTSFLVNFRSFSSIYMIGTADLPAESFHTCAMRLHCSYLTCRPVLGKRRLLRLWQKVLYKVMHNGLPLFFQSHKSYLATTNVRLLGQKHGTCESSLLLLKSHCERISCPHGSHQR